MEPLERKAFLYSHAGFNRGTVNWKTGTVSYPKE
jgi:hypothetical protein